MQQWSRSKDLTVDRHTGRLRQGRRSSKASRGLQRAGEMIGAHPVATSGAARGGVGGHGGVVGRRSSLFFSLFPARSGLGRFVIGTGK